MRILIKIVFVIFIAKGFDCIGRVCDNCCDCLKDKKEDKKEDADKKEDENKDEEKDENNDEKEKMEYEEIKEDENIKIKSLVNNTWYNSKENKPVLKIFKKKDSNDLPFKDNGDKILINLP